MPQADAGFGGRREYVRIKPLHLGFIAVGSAVVGGLIVLVVSLLVRPVLAPAVPIDPVLAQTDGEVSLDLVPVFEVDEEPEELEPSTEAPRKGKRGAGKRRQRRDKREHTSTSAAPLTRMEISTGIKENLHKLGPCFRTARKRNELTPGRHPLVVAFRIQPNGSVQDGLLTGPGYLVGKRIAKCVAGKLRTWKFPASSNGAPVRGLSLPVNVQ